MAFCKVPREGEKLAGQATLITALKKTFQDITPTGLARFSRILMIFANWLVLVIGSVLLSCGAWVRAEAK